MSLAREKTNSIRLYACIQTDCAQFEDLVTFELLAGVNSCVCFSFNISSLLVNMSTIIIQKKLMNSEHNHDDVII